MNMMAPYGGTLLTDLLIHASYILTAGAFVLRDILGLRLLAIAANICIATAAFRAGMGPNWIIVAWAAAFIAINLGHSVWLAYERFAVRLSEDEKRLYDAAFQTLDRVTVRKLLRRGNWETLAEKDCIARQGVHLDRLRLIAEGEAAVLLGGQVAARLSTGKFVGEIAFLSGEAASATVVATSPVKCLSWKKDDLERVFKRRPELLQVFQAAVGRDLASKIASHNIKLSTL